MAFFMLPSLVGMADVQCFAPTIEHLIVEVKPAEQFGEFLLEHLLAHIVVPTEERWPALGQRRELHRAACWFHASDARR